MYANMLARYVVNGPHLINLTELCKAHGWLVWA